jgi:ankyrin repeat protein
MKKIIACCCLLFACALPLAAHAELPDPTKFSVTLELGNVAQARRWLDEGLDPNFEGQLIGTGLMIGAWEGNVPLMELFLARGADIHRANRFGETALMLAAWKNRAEAVHWLLERGAQPNRPDREWTALHYATFSGNADLVDRLLTAGANPNARSTNGSTVIMMAAREGHTALAKRLLEVGANPAIQNDFNEDAVAWAMRQQNFDIAKSFTSAENFAELSRQAAGARKTVVRSIPAPDRVEELLRMARLAESRGRRKDAAAIYQRAIAALKAEQAPKKVGTDKTATAAAPKEVKGLVIRARRDQPEQQGLSVTLAEEKKPAQETTLVERLLDQARQAERTGNRAEALRLFRAASAQLKAGYE